uniref:Protein phosphatase 1 regulatory subunit 36 n=2 Tax=Latimeria chalumnae TaxID=7897 RepID=M3XJZ9_LATCH|nr:PREDICTED: protein phosphatase 1 regulatory subunit 36 isoform X2 [Latimeria chalumnae]XP_014340748.1 PREDICTED: protein phosphatase 1 regulatory subunit 36 isoform X2 [Latimeria chalumnae]XP_014340751.1 PREDICTED: protein phosphatase 1 regulatory subunit 36 isoform X2 [Latimeria chalumnae]|eukprot:XP_014340743.1 PREDICTED: protein phosphatase 1 regulatory subunit 36 isoform X2 [Latimeria chalumnae]
MAAVTGHWYWKDETKTLEFMNYKSPVELKKKKRRIKGMYFQQVSSKQADRMGPTSTNKRQVGAKVPTSRDAGVKAQTTSQGLPRPTMKHEKHEYVTLEDVKYVALNLLHENGIHHVPNIFSAVFRTEQLDEFLMALLFYISCYLERIALEKKPKAIMTEPSTKERREMALTNTKIELAQKELALVYSVLLLGLGMAPQHHMACGGSKVSAIYKDRHLFECLYSFCTYVAWVTFRRTNLHIIHEEIGRLLRSNTFNPAARANYPEDETANDTSETLERKKISPAEYRRLHPKRPAINSIVNQRSPMLISLLPSPKEKSQYLFQTHQQHCSSNVEVFDDDMLMEALSVAYTSRVGIIGEPYSHFNAATLVLIGAEPEDEEENEPDHEKAETTTSSFKPQGRASASKAKMSRQNTVVSRATTVGAYSSTE